MSKTVHHSPLILASGSPRRKELLEQMGISFEVIPSELDESTLIASSPVDYALAVARAKAESVSRNHRKNWVLAADTIVCLENTIFGKPRDAADANEMLAALSGRDHTVITAYSFMHLQNDFIDTRSVSTTVRFKTLSSNEIEWYIHTGEPFGKAGAYAIQGIGAFLVRTIKGSYTNVVGLPLTEVITLLQKAAGLKPGIKIGALK